MSEPEFTEFKNFQNLCRGNPCGCPRFASLTAAFALALTFTLSCSGGDKDDAGGGSNSIEGGGDNGGGSGSNINTFTDSRDGKVYKWVKIGNQTWMAQNLNYNASGSVCFENKDANCQKYGRLYDWETANMVCPSDWHIPGNAEWSTLLKSVDDDNQGNGEYASCAASTCYSSYTAGKYLKARSVWTNSYGQFDNSTDKYGFAALPGGYGSDYNSDLSFYGCSQSNTGCNSGGWWTANDDSNAQAYNLSISESMDGIVLGSTTSKDYFLSVRCIKDNGGNSIGIINIYGNNGI